MAPPPLLGKEKASGRRPHGDVQPLVINTNATRKAINNSLLVGRLLSPFKVHPKIIVQEL